MAFSPASEVYLLYTPLDKTYKNEIYFTDKDTQSAYFMGCQKHVFTDYSYLRKNNRLRVAAHVDELYDCNYVMYRNASYGPRWFYCFITDMQYINDKCTEITIETDVFQTWLFDVTFLDSFVVREHVIDDAIGANIIKEDLPTGDMMQSKIEVPSLLDRVGYIMATTYAPTGEALQGRNVSGLYSGVGYYYYDSTNTAKLAADIAAIENGSHSGSILFICAVPWLAVSASPPGDSGYVPASDGAALQTVSIQTNFSIDGYTPKNNKLFTFPYFSIYASTHDGQSNIYQVEYFEDKANLAFDYRAIIAAAPAVRLVPNSYKHVSKNYDEGLTLSGFPQCSYNVDAFKGWLAQNQLGLIMSGITAGAELYTGNYMGAAMNSLGMVNQFYEHGLKPNQARGSIGAGSINFALGISKFEFYYNTVTAQYAEMLDNYFEMYGYKVNKIKQPNLATRPAWNYVQTKDLNLKGDIPSSDMVIFKQIFNNGITLWHDSANVGNYTLNNH